MLRALSEESKARSVASIAILRAVLKLTARVYRPRNLRTHSLRSEARRLCDCDLSSRFGIIARNRSSSCDSSDRFSTAGGESVSAVFVFPPPPAAVDRCFGPSGFFALRGVSGRWILLGFAIAARLRRARHDFVDGLIDLVAFRRLVQHVAPQTVSQRHRRHRLTWFSVTARRPSNAASARAARMIVSSPRWPSTFRSAQSCAIFERSARSTDTFRKAARAR